MCIRDRGKPYYVYMTAGANKFLRIYYGRVKEYREVFQFGTFYRLKSPFEGNETVWMVTNEDRTLAIVGSVSYTHLDVYKRQPGSSNSRQRPVFFT